MNIEQALKRLERKVDLLYEKKIASKWVKVSVIMDATGWTSKEVRKYRENGLLEIRKSGRKVEYNLNSIPQQLVKKALST